MFSKKPASDDSDPMMAAPGPMKATELLKKDHRTVDALFAQFEETEEGEQKVALAREICTELTIHAELEEKIFYPAARKALDDDGEDLVNEATVEHRSLKMLIAEIDGSSARDALFEANVTVLKEYVQHHVKEEENEMFPKLEDSELDLDALGAKMARLKEELKAKVAEVKPRAGAKTVHVPALSEREDAATKSKGGNGGAKSASGNGSSKTTAKTTAKAKSASKAGRSTSRSQSAHR